MVELSKMMNGRYDREVEMQLSLKENNARGHQKKLNKERSRIKIR